MALSHKNIASFRGYHLAFYMCHGWTAPTRRAAACCLMSKKQLLIDLFIAYSYIFRIDPADTHRVQMLLEPAAQRSGAGSPDNASGRCEAPQCAAARSKSTPSPATSKKQFKPVHSAMGDWERVWATEIAASGSTSTPSGETVMTLLYDAPAARHGRKSNQDVLDVAAGSSGAWAPRVDTTSMVSQNSRASSANAGETVLYVTSWLVILGEAPSHAGPPRDGEASELRNRPAFSHDTPAISPREADTIASEVGGAVRSSIILVRFRVPTCRSADEPCQTVCVCKEPSFTHRLLRHRFSLTVAVPRVRSHAWGCNG
mmetsp:Transcript_23957/g.61470  ORF Transcript_23957/g.61470 Transcript_23957/m.61470 type:complete len:315 (+) Transcript_23957:57-1001(+)